MFHSDAVGPWTYTPPVADQSSIEWTQATWNPTTGCDRISSGCDNCYALTLAKRLKAMGSEKYQNDGNPATSGPGFDITVHPNSLDTPRRWREPRLIFVNSMSDLFHARVPEHFVLQVLQVIRETPQHTYQLLTKRPRRLQRLSEKVDLPANLWVGTTVENRSSIERADELRKTSAHVKFLSLEPLLGPLPELSFNGIHWVIVGGESGPRARPVDPAWVEELRDKALLTQVPFFFKQWGGRTPKANGRLLDGREWNEMPRLSARQSNPA